MMRVPSPLAARASLWHSAVMLRRPAFLCALVLAFAAPAVARDGLGMFGGWGAFRDPGVPRCYAIAMAAPHHPARGGTPYADVGSWPGRGVRGEVHFRLSQRVAGGAITLSLGGEHFRLVGAGADGWAADTRMDAAIVAGMRSAASMSVSGRDAQGHGFSDSYALAGAATAMDAAALGCAGLR